MLLAAHFCLLGFVAGTAVAVALTGIGLDRNLSPRELHVLWPASVLGLDFAGWADGSVKDFLLLLFAFVGNGFLYAALGGAAGALVSFLRRWG